MIFPLCLLVFFLGNVTTYFCDEPVSCDGHWCGLVPCGAYERAVADKCLSCCPYCPPEDERRYTGDDVDEEEYYDYPSYVLTDLEAYKTTESIMMWLYMMDSDYGNFNFSATNLRLKEVKKLANRKVTEKYNATYNDYTPHYLTDLEAYKATKSVMKWLYMMVSIDADFDYFETSQRLEDVRKLAYRKAIQNYRKAKKLKESES